MSTWEERMSAKAKARQVIAEAEEITRREAHRRRLCAANPPVHEDENGPIDWDDQHLGHYTHIRPAHGNGVMCSCGTIVGIFTIALSEDDPPLPERCEICEARGIQWP